MPPMKLSELMDKVFEYPGIYIGARSADKAFIYVCGYSVALQQTDFDWKDELEAGFSVWVCNRFGYSSTHTWASVCVFHSPDELESFNLAKELWEEYKAEKKERPPNPQS